MKNIFKQWAFVALTIAAVLIGCKKDDEQLQPQPQQQYDTLTFDTQSGTTSFSLANGGTQTFTITAGSGTYSVTSEDPTVATAGISGTTVEIIAQGNGETKITVKDTKSGQSKEFMVTVSTAEKTLEWQLSFRSNKMDSATGVAATTDGGIIVTGFHSGNGGDITTPNKGKNDVWVAKLTANGTLQWKTFFGGNDNDTPYDVQQTADGGYIIAGKTFSNDGDFEGARKSQYYADAFVIKLNANGQKEWIKFYGGDKSDEFHSVREIADGYVLSGVSRSKNGDVPNNKGEQDWWIVKINKTGNLVWSKSYGGSGDDGGYYPVSLCVVKEGGFAVVGYTASYDGDLVDGVKNGISFLRLDNEGNITQKKVYGKTKPFSVQQTADGGFVIGGDRFDLSGTGSNILVIKTKADGSIEWEKTFGGHKDDTCRGIIQTSDGNYIIAGRTNTPKGNGDITDAKDPKPNKPNSDYDMWIVKLDKDGNKLWDKALGGTGGEEPRANVVETKNKSVVIVGNTSSSNGDVTEPLLNNTLYDAWIAKIAVGTK